MTEHKKWVKLYDVAEQYEIKDKVGKGTYGTVFKAKNILDKKFYAIKKLENNDPKMQCQGFPITALREITLLKLMDHPNIIKLKQILLSKPSKRNLMRGSTFLVFEYMEHDLAGLFQKVKFSLPEIKCFARQLLEGVAYLHSQKLLHRDIKPANILLNDKGEMKVADFGLGRKCRPEGGSYTYKVVTLWYRAPQLILGCKYYNNKVDVWSIGCVIAEFFTHQILFRKQSDFVQLEKILQICGDFNKNNVSQAFIDKCPLFSQLVPSKSIDRKFQEYIRQLNPEITDDALDLLAGLLDLNPETRLSCEEALKHPFFSSNPSECKKSEIQKFKFEYHEFKVDEKPKQAKPQQSAPETHKKHEFKNERKKTEKNEDRFVHKEKKRRSYSPNTSQRKRNDSNDSSSSASVKSREKRREHKNNYEKQYHREKREHERPKMSEDHKRAYPHRYNREDSSRNYKNHSHYRENSREKEDKYKSEYPSKKSYNEQDHKHSSHYRHEKQQRRAENPYEHSKQRENKAGQDDRSDKYRQKNYSKGSREDKYERSERYEKGEKYSKPNKYEKLDKYQRSDKYDKSTKYDKPEHYKEEKYDRRENYDRKNLDKRERYDRHENRHRDDSYHKRSRNQQPRKHYVQINSKSSDQSRSRSRSRSKNHKKKGKQFQH